MESSRYLKAISQYNPDYQNCESTIQERIHRD